MRLILPLLLCLLALPAWAAKHAFVLANNAYDELVDLRNTHADAAAYGGAFEELGFDVTHHRDLTRAETVGAFDAFLRRVRSGDQVAFVYSGHGWSDGQSNYLVPTDAPRQGSDRRLRGQSLALRNGVNGVLDEIEGLGAGLTVAVIDACRDNPFKPPEGSRSVGLSRGLARVSPPQGTFVIFSAGEGQQALDRLPDDPPDQRLSVFSRVFVPNLTSGVKLEDAISTTQVEVVELARGYDGHKQLPAYYDQTSGKTCLSGDCSPQTVAMRPGPSACDRQYEKAEELNACFAYKAYASSCPNHMFNAFAKSYINSNCSALATTEIADQDLQNGMKLSSVDDNADALNTVVQQPEDDSSTSGFSYPFTASVWLSESDLSEYSSRDLRIMRNEIYARHGYSFKSADLQDHFSAQAWYNPVSQDAELAYSKMTAIERSNVDTIRKEERSR